MTGQKVSDAHAWFERTGGICYRCGQPGGYCLCTDAQPCECRDLHPMGSSRQPDALAAFADAPPAEVSPDQESLFADTDGGGA